MEAWSLVERWQYGVVRSLGLAWIAAALELVVLSARSALTLSLGEAVVLAAAEAAAVSALTLLIAAAGLGVYGAFRTLPAHRAIALHLGVTGGVLTAVLLAEPAQHLIATGRAPAAAAMGGLALGNVGIIALNARFWLARQELGRPVPLGFLPAAGLMWLALTALVAGVMASRGGGGAALEGDPSVLLLTTEGLSADDLRATTPDLHRLTRDATSFTDVITPSPRLAAAAGSVLTGWHPLRHRGLGPGLPMTPKARPLAARLGAEGFATAAFVGNAALGAHSGLAAGFQVFDDTAGAPVPGVGHTAVAGRLLGALGLLPGRDGADGVLRRALPWLTRQGSKPFFLWVHLADPRAPADRGAGAEAVSAALGALRTQLDTLGVADRTLVVVAGLRGPSGDAVAGGLEEAVVRVPLWVVAPARAGAPPMPRGHEVTASVRLLDVAATVLAWVALDPEGESEAVSLFGYAVGERAASLMASLVVDGPRGWRLGVRNQGVKVVADPALDTVRVYDLTADPGETTDVSADQPRALGTAKSLLSPDARALDGITAPGRQPLSPAVRAQLTALGYR
jgi:arylsulfatase A-like enzyme